jgi:hypothetical protein
MNSIVNTTATSPPNRLSDMGFMAQTGEQMASIITTTANYHCEVIKSLDARMVMLTELDRNLTDTAHRNGHQGEKTAEHFQVQMEMNYLETLIVRAETFHADFNAGIVTLKETANG